MFYCNSRYYSPELGRFIQPADVSSLNPSSINGLNLYTYVNNNPVGNAYNSSNFSAKKHMIVERPIILGKNNKNMKNDSKNCYWWVSLIKEVMIGLGEVIGQSSWIMTETGKAFSNYYFIYEGASRYQILDMLEGPSLLPNHPLGKTFKGISIITMAVDVFSRIYESIEKKHSFVQGTLNFTLAAVKNIGVYIVSSKVASFVGMAIGSKFGAALGAWAGPVGVIGGALAGALIGWMIDEFGDILIEYLIDLV